MVKIRNECKLKLMIKQGIQIMKCPLCGKELEPMAQNTAHPSQKPKWIILYHHPKNGCKLELNTLTEQSWVERSKSSSV